ncbi:hypothetical protein IW262DRAFT_1438680 [Armillaria fumosa]|nr:hypothetical protein IW262DRAFT_1438680 [Armillaria fumosa]
MFSYKALSFAVVALPFVARSVVAHCNRQYTIQEGDICDSISAANNVSTYQLATINAGYIDSACSNLQIGATICLGYLNEDCSDTYVVEAEDTCEEIADGFSIDEATLYNNNPNINDKCTNIYVGEVLCVASTIAVPPVTSSTATLVTSSTVIPVTTSTPAPVTTVTYATTSSSSAASAATSSASTDDGDDDDDGDDEDDGDDDDLPWCDEL